MSLSIPFPFGWLLNKKAARVEVNISLAFLHWVGIALHPWPFVSDIAIFVLKGDVKLQLTNYYAGRPGQLCDGGLASFHPSVPSIFITLIKHAAHTQRVSPRGSTQHGRRTFLPEYYWDGQACFKRVQLTYLHNYILCCCKVTLWHITICQRLTASIGVARGGQGGMSHPV